MRVSLTVGVPTIPDYAKLVFNRAMGGWAWISIHPTNGRCIWWLAYYEQGIEHLQFRWFYGSVELEQFCDAIEELKNA